MKQLFFIAAIVLASFTANAQCDSALGKVQGAILLQPKVVNYITKDTATQLTWSVFDLSRDTTKGCNSYVALYNRTCKTVYQANIPIPASIVNKWGTNDSVIDDYILSALNLVKKIINDIVLRGQWATTKYFAVYPGPLTGEWRSFYPEPYDKSIKPKF